jgi:hypothetical protein
MKKFAFFASIFIILCSFLLSTKHANAWHRYRRGPGISIGFGGGPYVGFGRRAYHRPGPYRYGPRLGYRRGWW